MTYGLIKKSIKRAASDFGEEKIHLEFSGKGAHGDYSSNIALRLFSKSQTSKFKNPRGLAQSLVEKLKGYKELAKIVSKIETAGPGFINFYLKNDVLLGNLIRIDKNYGKSDIGKGKVVVIDYSSPNIAKAFGIGHLRSTIIGQALYNIYRFLGYKVIGDNHLGDWGTQFGKLLFMLKDMNDTKLKSLKIGDLERLYVNFHRRVEKKPEMESAARKWFKKLEEGDAKARKLWQLCVDISLKEFNKIYNLLGVTIDFAYGESFYGDEMKKMLADPKIKKFLTKGENGALVINLIKQGIDVPLMFLKSDGATTYATRDLATIAFRVNKWNPDIIIYEVGAEQAFYFRQIFATAGVLGLVNKKIKFIHTAHGLYLAPDGKKFATRKGKTVKLEEILDEVVERAKKLGNRGEVAKQVGIGAIKYFDLMHAVESNVVFSWDKIMNMEGNSGPYLQYTFARANSVLRKARRKSEIKNLKLKAEELTLLRLLFHFPEIIKETAEKFSPNVLCAYLYELATEFNTFYGQYRILNSDNEEFRLSLVKAVAQVIKSGLNLLGIQSPEKM